MKARIAHLWPTPAQREFILWIKLTHPEFHPAMKHHKPHVPAEPTEAEIQHAAYLLWIENGRPEGRDLDHWLAAKEMLCHRHGRDARTRSPAPEIAAPAPRR
jgi:hypothetical protein